MKKEKITDFIGKQLSRLKLGQTYYSIFTTTFTALGILILAFPQISIITLIWLFVFILIATFFIGYLMDVLNISTKDHMKSLDISLRYLNVSDSKNNDFRILMMETMGEWLQTIQNGKPIDKSILDEKYKKFQKKWSPP